MSKESKAKIVAYMMEHCSNINSAQTIQEIAVGSRLDATTVRRIFYRTPIIGVITSPYTKSTNTKPAKQYYYSAQSLNGHLTRKAEIHALNPTGQEIINTEKQEISVPRIPNNSTSITVMDLPGLTTIMKDAMEAQLNAYRHSDWAQLKPIIIERCEAIIETLKDEEYKEGWVQDNTIALAAIIVQLTLNIKEA